MLQVGHELIPDIIGPRDRAIRHLKQAADGLVRRASVRRLAVGKERVYSLVHYASLACAIWIKLPHVSSSTAVMTAPRSVGGWMKRTPSLVNRSCSATTSASANDANGMPSSTSAALNGLTAGWASGSRSSSVPFGSDAATTVSQRCAPSDISRLFTNPSTLV